MWLHLFKNILIHTPRIQLDKPFKFIIVYPVDYSKDNIV